MAVAMNFDKKIFLIKLFYYTVEKEGQYLTYTTAKIYWP